MPVSVRIAGDGDARTLAALRREWNEEDAGGPIDDAGFESAFAAWLVAEGDTRTFFVVELDGDPIGMGNVKRYSRMPSAGRTADAWGYVGNVYIRAEHRGGGIGAQLMDALHAWSWTQGYDKLRLSPADRAIPFYERLGWWRSALLQLDR
jgi:GNAT superfamily N-acetyltransferase